MISNISLYIGQNIRILKYSCFNDIWNYDTDKQGHFKLSLKLIFYSNIVCKVKHTVGISVFLCGPNFAHHSYTTEFGL